MARKGRGQLSAIERLPEECGPIITWAATALQDRDRTQTDIYEEFFLKMQALQAELASGGSPLVDPRPVDDLGVAEGPAR